MEYLDVYYSIRHLHALYPLSDIDEWVISGLTAMYYCKGSLN